METAIFHPVEYTTVICETFNCSNFAKWVVCDGMTTHISGIGYNICDGCAKNIINNLPMGMVVGARDIQAELEGVFNAKVLALEAVHAKEVAQAINIGRNEMKQEVAEAFKVPVPLPFDQPEPDEKPVNEGIFRCLDCDKEFDNKRALSNHMRIHEPK